MINPYELLGVAENATDDAIKKAYRQLAKVYHPDRNAGNAEAAEKFKSICEAYDLLSDPVKRRQFDQTKKTTKAEGQQKNADNKGKNKARQPFDPAKFDQTFSQFFGFDPKQPETDPTQGEEAKKKDPLDTTEMFKKFMGF